MIAMATKMTSDVEYVVAREREAEEAMKAMKAFVSRGNPLRLPKLLNQRRLECLIPDGAFREQAAFGRIHVWQLAEPDFEDGKFGKGSMLWIPEADADAQKRETNRGIVISAGLLALDHLRSHGIDLGHIVRFTKFAPATSTAAIVGGIRYRNLVMDSGNITASEDLEQDRRDGLVVEWFNPKTNQHEWKRKKGKAGTPLKPFVPADQ